MADSVGAKKSMNGFMVYCRFPEAPPCGNEMNVNDEERVGNISLYLYSSFGDMSAVLAFELSE